MKLPAFHQLKSLGEQIVQVLDAKLTAGESPLECARWLQNEQGVLKDAKPDTLKKMIQRYRQAELRQKVLERIALATKNSPTPNLKRRLDTIGELEILVEKQKARVDKMMALEEGKPMLLKPTSEEIKLLQALLVDYGRLSLETGLMPRAAKTIKGILAQQNGEQVAFSWTEEQAKMLQELTDVDYSTSEG